MAKEERQIKNEDAVQMEKTIDPYTGELKPVPKDAGQFIEVVPEDEDIKADFAERQRLAVGGRDVLLEELEDHNSLSPEVSGGDLNASWQTANGAGEETVGGSVPTPDQDVVDELGEAAGLTYKDDEPLNSDQKVLDRDRNRWELNPASAQDQEEQPDDEEDDDEFYEDEDLDELDELNELDEDEEDEDDDELDDEDEHIDAEIEIEDHEDLESQE